MIFDTSVWYGDWFDYVLEWERVLETQTEVPIFSSAYEDLKRVSDTEVCIVITE